MKSITLILGFLLITSCAQLSTPPSPVNIDGIWQGEYTSGMGGPPIRLTFNFKCNGDYLTGTVHGVTYRQGEWITLENGKIKGNSISFLTTPLPKSGIPSMKYKYNGKVDGDKVKMTFTVKKSGPNWWKTPRREKSRPMIDDEGSLLRSPDYMEGSSEGLSVGVNRLNSQSGEFTIFRVK